MEYNVEVVADYACACGEGPLWHEDENKLYWVDIPKGRLFRYDPETGDHEIVLEQGEIGGFTIQEDGSLLLFMEKGKIALWKGTDDLEVLHETIPEAENGRFNDVAADPEGRVFCGTLLQGKGALYKLDTGGSLVKLLDGIGCSNGIGFTPDLKQMYFTDSATRKIYLFDYNRQTGEISNQRDFLKTPEGEGVPDGMTVDAQGNIWSARWGGNGVFKYSPEGKQIDEITIDSAKNITSVIFGGNDYTDMYITSASGENKEENGPSSGALFKITGSFKGVPEFKSKIIIYS